MAQSHDQRGRRYPRRDVEEDRTTDVDVDLERNELAIETTIVKTRTVELDELFLETPDDGVADARLRLWADGAGWSGFELRDGRFYRVNYSAARRGEDSGEYVQEDRVDRDAVVEQIVKHVEDEHAGRFGDFRRGCSPP